MTHELIFNLLIAHIISDFYLQWGNSCRNKIIYSIKGKDLWFHSLIIGMLSWAAIWDCRGWWLAIGITTSHFLIDWLKSYLQLKWNIFKIDNKSEIKLVDGDRKRSDLWIFLSDQILHITIIVAFSHLWMWANNDWCQFEWVSNMIATHPLWVKTAIAMLLALKPANILILYILEACKTNIGTTENDDHGEFHSGELIGWLERGLILLFVVLTQYEAIGFLIAAKSILRFNEASSGSEKSEYVLTGTLLSLAFALCLGIAAVKIQIP